MADWDGIIKNGIVKRPGEHCLVVGTTGTGKTQLLYYLMAVFTQVSKKETIVWFDSGKSAEALKLTEFKECTIHHPIMTDIKIIPTDPKIMERIRFKEFNEPKDLWNGIEKDRINIFCIEPFHRDPKEYSIKVREVFKALIDQARDYKLKRAGVIPLTIFIDELQWLVPTDRTALNAQHNEGAKWFQRNIETLRSQGIRIIGATQNWMKIRAGARESFSWLFLKRGARFLYDRQVLQKYNKLWMRLNNGEFFLVMPDSQFSDESITTPFYGDGCDLGEIEYHEIKMEAEPEKVKG